MGNRGCLIIGGVVVLFLVFGCMCTALFAGLSYAGPGVRAGGVTETIATEIPVSQEGPASLHVSNPVGGITIRRGREGVIEVQATKRASSFLGSRNHRLLAETRVRTEINRQPIGIEVDLPDVSDAPLIGGNVAVDLLITVPRDISLDIISNVGDVGVTDVQGNLRVRSDVGDVRLQDVVVVEECDVMTNVGGIDFRGRLPEREGEVLLQTDVGDIDVAVPAGSQFALDAETNVGEVQSGFELRDAQSGPANEVTGRWLKGGVNTDANGVSVVLRAQTGDIEVEPQQ